MPHREYDIQADLLTLCRKRRQLQFICSLCGYWRTWHSGELALLAKVLRNCKVCEFQKKAKCSHCGGKQPRAVIDFADCTTRRWVPHRVGTLGDMLRERRYVSVSCERIGCGNNMRPDLAALIEKYGADYPLQRFLERCRCAKCQARWPQVSLQAPQVRAKCARQYIVCGL